MRGVSSTVCNASMAARARASAFSSATWVVNTTGTASSGRRPGGAGMTAVPGDPLGKGQKAVAGLGVDGGGKGEAVRIRRLKAFLKFCGGFS